MALVIRWLVLGLAVIIWVSLSGCSKEGGYSVTEKVAPHSVETEACSSPEDFKITAWGPEWTTAGSVFNRQPDGSAALWLQMNQSLEGTESVITIDQIVLKSDISGKLITAIVPASVYAEASVHRVYVTIKHGKMSVQSNVVSFVVRKE